MIKSYAYDIEVLPNFFSVTFVDINSYLKTFKDCKNDKGKKIPLTQKYSVKDIKEKLDKVEKHQFYITDTDNSQLLQMMGFINNMTPKRLDDGSVVVHHLFGYNSMSYDKLMMACLLMNAFQTNTTKELITKLYETSKKIIELQDDKDVKKNDYMINVLTKYKLPYKDIDVMKVFALNKCGSMTNDKGEKIYFGKSLKQTSINLQWYELLEYDLPPISDEDRHYYDKLTALWENKSLENINRFVEKWDRYILDKWIPNTMHYNLNDVYIVCEMIRLFLDEILLRYNLSKAYEVDLLNSSRSNIADKLFIKFYSEFSGLDYKHWGGKNTERKAMSFKKVIFDNIHFKTKELQDLLEDMKTVVIYSIGKDSFKREVKLGNLTYTIATGGLHSQDIPRELISKAATVHNIPFTGVGQWNELTDDSYIYVHFDIASFYPSIMSVYNIAPKHMDEHTFVKLITWLKDTRVAAKHSEEPLIDGIPKDLVAGALKIVINSIYGKLGYEYGDICDRLAVLKVTINGQLMIMMLCEALELEGIEVMSANTDGIVVKITKDKKSAFDRITKEWMDYTKLGADSEEYDRYINRDINNYIVRELNGKITYKGALNPDMYLNDLQKGYDMPIVAKAVSEYFLNNKPIFDTLYEEENILMFCKTQNVGRQYDVAYSDGNPVYEYRKYYIDNGNWSDRYEVVTEEEYEEYKRTPRNYNYKIEKEVISTKYPTTQRNFRFYVSNGGYYLYKIRKVSGKRESLAAKNRVTILNTLDDKNIVLRDINYGYYYNECLKIIDPIKLQISPNQKPTKGKSKSGKSLIKKYSGQYNSLFDNE